MLLLTCRECGGVEKENLLSLAGDLGLARSGSLEVARRPLNERPMFRLVRLRHESTAMHSGFLENQANVKTSPDALRMRRLHRGRKEPQLAEVHDESLPANESIDSEQNSHWSVKRSPCMGRWWQHAPSFAGVGGLQISCC